MADALTEYARGRAREDEADSVRPIVGDEQADNIAKIRTVEYQSKLNPGLMQPIMDYVVSPLKTGLAFLNDVSQRFRGGMTKGDFNYRATGEDVTGLKNEEITPQIQEEMLHGAWYNQAFPFLQVPKRTINQFAEMATDPFMLIGAGGAPKVANAGFDNALKATQATTKVSEEATLARKAAATEARPATAPDGAPSPSAQAETVVPQPQTVEASQAAHAATDEHEALLAAQQQADHAASVEKFKADTKAGQAKINKNREGVKPAEDVTPPTPVMMKGEEHAQQVLTGFGRYMRAAKGEPEAEGAAALTVPNPKQMKIAFNYAVDPEALLKSAHKALDEATLSDKTTLAYARKLLDDRTVNPFSIAHKDTSGIPDQAFVAAGAAVERSVVGRFDETANAFIKDPSDANLEKVMAELAHSKAVTTSLSADAAERAAAMRMEKTRQSPEVNAMKSLLRDLPEGTTPERMIFAYQQMKSTGQKAGLLHSIFSTANAAKGPLLHAMLNGMISGTALPVMNFAAGVSLQGAKIFERWQMSKFTNTVAPHEASVMAWSLVKSYTDLAAAHMKYHGIGGEVTPAQARVAKSFSEKMTNVKERALGISEDTKLDIRRNVSGRNFGKEDSIFTPALDFVGTLSSIPSFMVGTSDAFLSFAAKNAMIESIAYREAHMQSQAAMSMGKQLNKADVGAMVAKRREQLAANPEQKVMFEGTMQSLNKTGDEAASLIAMMSPIKGKVGQAVQNATEDSVMFRSVVPFFRVQYQSAAESIFRIPAIGAIAPSVRANFAAGGELRAKAIAQMGTGLMLGATASALTGIGIMNGDGPVDPQMRADWAKTHTPNSIDFGGGVNFPYAKLGPVGKLMQFVSNLTYMIPHVADDEAASTHIMMAVGASFAGLLSDQNFNKDMHDIMGLVTMRDAAGFAKYVEAWPTKFIPYSTLLKQMNKQILGYTTASDGMIDQIRNTIPGMGNGIKFRNEVGEVSEVPNWHSWNGLLQDTGFVPKKDSPYKPIIDKLAESHLHLTGPTRIQDGVMLHVDEWMELRRIYGQEKMNGHALIEDLSKLMEQRQFNFVGSKPATDGPLGSKQAMISELSSNYHKAAWATLQKQKDEHGLPKWPTLADRVKAAASYKAGVDTGVKYR